MSQQIINYDEEMVGVNHATKSDTLNRAFVIDHTSDGHQGHNLVYNGCMRGVVNGSSFAAGDNDDGASILDGWVLLSDGNDIVDVSQETSVVPTGVYASMKLDVETADKKFGIIHFVSGKDAKEIIGGVASLSFKARLGTVGDGTHLGAIRAAVIAWDGAEDAYTEDVVSAWGAAGTNPTMVANWTLENVPAALSALTAAFQTYTIENISIDTASTKNVAVFIWADDVTTTVGDLLYITEVQLQKGMSTSAFERRPFNVEALLNKYSSVATGTYTGTGDASQAITGVGLDPTVLITGSTENATHYGQGGAMKTADMTVDNEHYDIDSSAGLGFGLASRQGIKSLDSDGFTVGLGSNDVRNMNRSGVTYYYMAWG